MAMLFILFCINVLFAVLCKDEDGLNSDVIADQYNRIQVQSRSNNKEVFEMVDDLTAPIPLPVSCATFNILLFPNETIAGSGTYDLDAGMCYSCPTKEQLENIKIIETNSESEANIYILCNNIKEKDENDTSIEPVIVVKSRILAIYKVIILLSKTFDNNKLRWLYENIQLGKLLSYFELHYNHADKTYEVILKRFTPQSLLNNSNAEIVTTTGLRAKIYLYSTAPQLFLYDFSSLVHGGIGEVFVIVNFTSAEFLTNIFKLEYTAINCMNNQSDFYVIVSQSVAIKEPIERVSSIILGRAESRITVSKNLYIYNFVVLNTQTDDSTLIETVHQIVLNAKALTKVPKSIQVLISLKGASIEVKNELTTMVKSERRLKTQINMSSFLTVKRLKFFNTEMSVPIVVSTVEFFIYDSTAAINTMSTSSVKLYGFSSILHLVNDQTAVEKSPFLISTQDLMVDSNSSIIAPTNSNFYSGIEVYPLTMPSIFTVTGTISGVNVLVIGATIKQLLTGSIDTAPFCPTIPNPGAVINISAVASLKGIDTLYAYTPIFSSEITEDFAVNNLIILSTVASTPENAEQHKVLSGLERMFDVERVRESAEMMDLETIYGKLLSNDSNKEKEEVYAYNYLLPTLRKEVSVIIGSDFKTSGTLTIFGGENSTLAIRGSLIVSGYVYISNTVTSTVEKEIIVNRCIFTSSFFKAYYIVDSDIQITDNQFLLPTLLYKLLPYQIDADNNEMLIQAFTQNATSVPVVSKRILITPKQSEYFRQKVQFLNNEYNESLHFKILKSLETVKDKNQDISFMAAYSIDVNGHSMYFSNTEKNNKDSWKKRYLNNISNISNKLHDDEEGSVSVAEKSILYITKLSAFNVIIYGALYGQNILQAFDIIIKKIFYVGSNTIFGSFNLLIDNSDVENKECNIFLENQILIKKMRLIDASVFIMVVESEKRPSLTILSHLKITNSVYNRKSEITGLFSVFFLTTTIQNIAYISGEIEMGSGIFRFENNQTQNTHKLAGGNGEETPSSVMVCESIFIYEADVEAIMPVYLETITSEHSKPSVEAAAKSIVLGEINSSIAPPSPDVVKKVYVQTIDKKQIEKMVKIPYPILRYIQEEKKIHHINLTNFSSKANKEEAHLSFSHSSRCCGGSFIHYGGCSYGNPDNSYDYDLYNYDSSHPPYEKSISGTWGDSCLISFFIDNKHTKDASVEGGTSGGAVKITAFETVYLTKDIKTNGKLGDKLEVVFDAKKMTICGPSGAGGNIIITSYGQIIIGFPSYFSSDNAFISNQDNIVVSASGGSCYPECTAYTESEIRNYKNLLISGGGGSKGKVSITLSTKENDIINRKDFVDDKLIIDTNESSSDECGMLVAKKSRLVCTSPKKVSKNSLYCEMGLVSYAFVIGVAVGVLLFIVLVVVIAKLSVRKKGKKKVTGDEKKKNLRKPTNGLLFQKTKEKDTIDQNKSSDIQASSERKSTDLNGNVSEERDLSLSLPLLQKQDTFFKRLVTNNIESINGTQNLSVDQKKTAKKPKLKRSTSGGYSRIESVNSTGEISVVSKSNSGTYNISKSAQINGSPQTLSAKDNSLIGENSDNNNIASIIEIIDAAELNLQSEGSEKMLLTLNPFESLEQKESRTTFADLDSDPEDGDIKYMFLNRLKKYRDSNSFQRNTSSNDDEIPCVNNDIQEDYSRNNSINVNIFKGSKQLLNHNDSSDNIENSGNKSASFSNKNLSVKFG